MPVNIREKSGNAENFAERSKHAGCYAFSIQETWNVLFRMSKEMHTVLFQRQEMTDILISR